MAYADHRATAIRKRHFPYRIWEKYSSNTTLQRGITQTTKTVEITEQLNAAIAKPAFTIEKDNALFGAASPCIPQLGAQFPLLL
jgi:hypothetical protein